MPRTEPKSPSRKRCLGLELGGGKSARTALVALDYYPEQQKVFIAESYSQLQGGRELSGDEILLQALRDLDGQILSVNAPLTLPPCFTCALPVCPGTRKCAVPEVVWMREEGHRLGWEAQKLPTPYTQRPVDVAMRGLLQQGLPVDVPVDETLGAGPAPLAARMRYLARHLPGLEFCEVHPRLVVARLSEWFPLTVRQLKRYRDIHEGFEQRQQIVDLLGDGGEGGAPQLFLYQEDRDAIARELPVFDAFICALVAVFKEAGLTDANLPGFSPTWGATLVPRRRLRSPPVDIGYDKE